MSEDKDILERRVGINLKGKNEPNQDLSRRGFGKVAALAGVAAAAAWLGLSSTEGSQGPEGDIFEGGFFGLFEGKVLIKKGAIIYDRPAAWTKYEPEKPFTTSPDEDTQIETIKQGEEFELETPLLFFRPPHQLSDPSQVVKVGEKEVDLRASYVVFKSDAENLPESVVRSINLSTTKVACVNMGVAGTIEYQPKADGVSRFEFTPEAVKFK